MKHFPFSVVLGSRSPRRLELLKLLLPEIQIEVCPPVSAEEPGFEEIQNWDDILERLQFIAREKNDAVSREISDHSETPRKVLTADTIIAVPDGEGMRVLGKPPEPDWRETVRFWFKTFLLGKIHRAATAVCVSDGKNHREEIVVTTHVTFASDDENLLEWYLDTEEPRGKAGGYGIQAAGSMFVEKVEGSVSNVVGLPLRETREMLEKFSDVSR